MLSKFLEKRSSGGIPYTAYGEQIPPPPFFIRRVVRHGLRGGVVLLVEYATGPRAEHGVSHAVYSVERVATLVGGGQDLYTALQNTLSRGKPP